MHDSAKCVYMACGCAHKRTMFVDKAALISLC